jgi:glycogen operon protein
MPGALSDFGARFTGSADLFARTGRRPYASVNFVTAHDGFTLADLVSYERKHNEANGDANHDGETFNRSWNNGVEGPTGDPAVLERRTRQRRSLLATLLLSQGVPMLLGGDELGRTQHGNNNAYCQDSEVSWYDWGAADLEMLDYTRRLIRFRRSHPVFHRRRWFEGGATGEAGLLDIGWFAPDGSPMDAARWQGSDGNVVGVFMSPDGLVGDEGQPIADDSFFIAFNGSDRGVPFSLPDAARGDGWALALDTALTPSFAAEQGAPPRSGPFDVGAYAVVVMQRVATGSG